MTNPNYPNRATRSAETHKLISQIQNTKKRNLLRGFSNKRTLSNREAELIRKNNTAHDNLIIGALLKGKCGLLENLSPRGHQFKKQSKDLFKLLRFPPLHWRSEICYSAGYVNSSKEQTLEILEAMRAFANIPPADAEVAGRHLLQMAKLTGASNYLSYKLAYVRSANELSPTLTGIVSDIEEAIGHRDAPGLHFSALENLSLQISLFVVARRRISGLNSLKKGSFRASLGLSNFIPTPLDQDDVSGFILRASESSLIDLLYAVITIFNLGADFDAVRRELELRLDSDILRQIRRMLTECGLTPFPNIVTDYYRSQNEEGDESLAVYRASAAFLEYPTCAIFRSKVDRVIGVRLLADAIEGEVNQNEKEPQDFKNNLLKDNDETIDEYPIKNLDTFYRTFLFLKHISDRNNILELNESEVTFIFEHTVGLDSLLSEDEMRALYLIIPREAKGLMAVLALALYRQKSVDPDIDFEFRTDFIAHVLQFHQGRIQNLINSLLGDSPSVAHYIVSSLDEVTLEKMYTLVSNASEASEIRRDVLTAVGQRFNRLEFLIEADAISTRAKVSKLQQYFDSSRMYVDSVAMRKWLDGNPTISTEQYRTLSRRKISAPASIQDLKAYIIKLSDADEYLIYEIAKDAFEQFCLNSEFGIESYLGRRIRHNTLQGVMIEMVDAVLKKPEHQVVVSTSTIRAAIDAWLGVYNAMIDKLRRERLQFKVPGSLFDASLRLDDRVTKENIRQLAGALELAGGADLLNDMVIAFCWKQIAPQLDNASRFIKTSLLNEANKSIDVFFSRANGATPESRLKADLHEAVNEVFKKVASWFQLPQTGFIPASVRSLSHIILIDMNRAVTTVQFSGNAVDHRYTGISVHRIYDCLAVLLQNAHKHGTDGSDIMVSVHADESPPDSLLEMTAVKVSSVAAAAQYVDSRIRIRDAIDSKESGIDMVTEGYTGIKKVKFITRASEGFHTVSFESEDESKRLIVGFTLHSEKVTEEAVVENVL